jgi:Fatty acid hydroxylase superfamily
MTSADGKLTGLRGLITVLRYYLGHAGILLYLVPNVLLVTWLLAVWNLTHFAWFLVGFIVFLPQEYLTHVHILHFKAPSNKLAYKFLYRAHYGHHEFPRRIDLMWIPVWLTLPLLIVNMAVLGPIARTPGNTLALMSGLFTGYLLFEWCHLLCHVPLRLRSRVFSSMRTRHLWHHYRNEHYWFSVQQASWPFDTMGHTAGTPETVPHSSTSFSLGVEESDPRVEAARKFFATNSTGNIERSEIWL